MKITIKWHSIIFNLCINYQNKRRLNQVKIKSMDVINAFIIINTNSMFLPLNKEEWLKNVIFPLFKFPLMFLHRNLFRGTQLCFFKIEFMMFQNFWKNVIENKKIHFYGLLHLRHKSKKKTFKNCVTGLD